MLRIYLNIHFEERRMRFKKNPEINSFRSPHTQSIWSFVTKIFETCLIFGLHSTNDQNRWNGRPHTRAFSLSKWS